MKYEQAKAQLQYALKHQKAISISKLNKLLQSMNIRLEPSESVEVKYLKSEIKKLRKQLMKQVERVEELELEINYSRDEVKKWQRFYEESEESHLEALELLESIVNQNKRLREALAFYADEKSWMNREVTILMDGEPTDVEDCPAIFDDGGNIARKALEGTE